MMSRLDWFVTSRMASRIMGTVLVFFFMILLSESLDYWRFVRISRQSGEWAAWMAIGTAATRWTIKSLPVTTLLGAIIGLVEFQSHREFVVMKAAGVSVWRIMRGPVTFMLVLGLLVTLCLESVSTQINREFNPTPPGLGGGVARSTSGVWLDQTGEEGSYILGARRQRDRGQALSEIVVYPRWESDLRILSAEEAQYEAGSWVFQNVTLTSLNGEVEQVETYRLGTSATESDLRLNVGSTEDFTFFELIDALNRGISEPLVRSAALTRLLKLTSLPLLLVGSLLIAFAFTAGYRRDNAYGATIIYGIILGFVVFVITEMADRAGSSGVLNPAYATWGPAAVAVLTGFSVLLRKEDGRA